MDTQNNELLTPQQGSKKHTLLVWGGIAFIVVISAGVLILQSSKPRPPFVLPTDQGLNELTLQEKLLECIQNSENSFSCAQAFKHPQASLSCEELGQKDECILTIAKVTRTPSLCERITTPTLAAQCRREVVSFDPLYKIP